MTEQSIRPSDRAVVAALSAGDASTRLRAAMAAGTDPNPALADDLVAVWNRTSSSATCSPGR